MVYPDALINSFDSAAAFAEAASKHVMAPPRQLTAAAVYQWRQKDRGVPWMWRPVVSAMMAETDNSASRVITNG
jgi:hypothetical protein